MTKKKRIKKHYPTDVTRHETYKKDGKSCFILPAKFKYGFKDCYARPFYEKLGLKFVDECIKAHEMLVEIPEGWKMYRDDYNGYWRVLCDEKDRVILDIFAKYQYGWCEDFFSRTNGKRELKVSEIIDYDEYRKSKLSKSGK